MAFPDEFHQARINLEIDFGEKGGLQRFTTVRDIDAWLNAEEEFWNWLKKPPATNHHQYVGEVLNQFWQGLIDCRNHLTNGERKWDQLRPQIRDLKAVKADKSRSSDERENASRGHDERTLELQAVLDGLCEALASRLGNTIRDAKYYLPSSAPAAQFIKELSLDAPDEAIYALDQILQEDRGSSHQRQVEHAGRMMAALFRKDLNRKVRPDQQAFKKAVETWSRELAEFKARYEAQEAKFQEISDRHQAADDAWASRSEQMAEAFSGMRTEKEADLNALKSTFETHMQLKGPLIYWRGKRREHTIGKKRMAWASGISGVLGAAAIAGAAYLFLPKETASETIPWRNIGLFLFISTFVLWLVRLFVKLMLSHIHLAADAREREVMISTFMALMRRQEGREGVEKMDLALVLAPIFKPSTTGVIKDDGGPTTLTDFISRLAGKT